MRGCFLHHKKASGDKVDNVEVDTEQGSYVTPVHEEIPSTTNTEKSLGTNNVEHHAREPAGFWGYVFQIIFQVRFSKPLTIGMREKEFSERLKFELLTTEEFVNLI